MNLLQKCNAHTSLQFYRRWSNRFGENGLTDACRAVFQKQAAPKSHAFLFCNEPLPPGMRCGELRRGLSSREPGAESLKHRKLPRTESASPLRMKTVGSTEFPLRRLAVRGCERTMRSIREPHQRCGGVSACSCKREAEPPKRISVLPPAGSIQRERESRALLNAAALRLCSERVRAKRCEPEKSGLAQKYRLPRPGSPP